MLGRVFRTADPFEGRGARRTQFRIRVEGFLAFILAIGACGLTAAAWFQLVAPLFAARLGLG